MAALLQVRSGMPVAGALHASVEPARSAWAIGILVCSEIMPE